MTALWLFFHPFGLVGWALPLVVLLMLISLGLRIYTISRSRRFFRAAGARRGATPEQILARRFALGQIDEAEYRSRLAALAGRERPGG